MSTPIVPSAAPLAGKYLTVVLDNEAYGLNILKIREVIRTPEIVPVAHMPDHVKGVTDIRGRMMLVVDLRVKFGLKASFGVRTSIVVIQVSMPTERSVQIGLIVDRLEEVVNVTPLDIEPAARFGAKVDAACVLGVANVKFQTTTLLDLDRLVALEAEAIRAIGRRHNVPGSARRDNPFSS